MKPGRPPKTAVDARLEQDKTEARDTTENELKLARYLLEAVRATGDKELQLIGGLVQLNASLLERIERDEKDTKTLYRLNEAKTLKIALLEENVRNLNNRVRTLEERTI